MLPSNRSYDSISHATRRDHLLPVEPTVFKRALAGITLSDVGAGLCVFAFPTLVMLCWAALS